ncbi:YheU family protein [Litoribrevibacter euphylliae]|uniref:YheU family protein n=1 Tax=Litoribrevibacter euphylliae TaxID=1834034 RepID=A0ABV7H7F3_9GAMM
MAIEVPWQQLSQDALEGLIESFISREGTDYGEIERSLEDKKQDVVAQLRSGAAVIIFDEEAESCNILSREQWKILQQRSAEDEYFGSV